MVQYSGNNYSLFYKILEGQSTKFGDIANTEEPKCNKGTAGNSIFNC
jgi:hypothetical protein